VRRFLPAFVLSALFLAAAFAARADAAQIAAAAAKPVSLHVQAVLAEGARKAVTGPVTWTVTELFNDKKPGEVVGSKTEASPTFSLPPGKYLVTGKMGEAQGQETVELTSAPVTVNVNLNAGVLRVNLIPYAGAKVVSDPVHWELFNYSRGSGAKARVSEANAPAWEFILPAGGYVLRAAYEGTLSELVVPLAAGQTFNYTLNLYAGTVKTAAVTEKGGGFKDPVSWEVVRAADRTQLVTSASSPSGQFTLREGRYIVLARQGNLAGEAPLEVKAGKSSSVKVTMKTVAADQVAALEKASQERKQVAEAALAAKPAAAPAAATPATTQVAAAPAAAAAAAAATPAPAQPAAPGAAAVQPSTTRSLAETMKLAEEAQTQKKQGEPAATAAAATPTPVAAADATAGAGAPPAAAPAPADATAAAASAPAASTTAAADAAAKPKGSVKVSAWSKASEKFQDPVEWQIRRVQDNGAVLPDLVESKTAAAPKFALPAGSYVIWGRQGTLIGKQKFEVQPDQTVAIRVFMQTPKLTEKAANTTTSAEPAAAPTSSGG
jgi:hypothetical protein